MSTQYGGDEIGALVLDPGTHSTRAGFAGEDTPKSLIPSNYGVVSATSKRYYGDGTIHVPRPGMEVENYMHEGAVRDFDAAADVWSHIFGEQLRTTVSEAPLMITEPSWNVAASRERTMEIAFEKMNVPASYLLKGVVAAAFASGKSTALVIDIGHGVTSVTPVYDGLVLKRGLQKQAFAGAALNVLVDELFKERHLELPPHFAVKQKGAPETGKDAVVKMPEKLTNSFLSAERTRIVEEYKESVLQVYEATYNELTAQQRPRRIFEFPTGRQESFKQERFKIPEALFTSDDNHQSLQDMIAKAVNSTEIDVRPILLQNIIITGGSSLIPGLESRLQTELLQIFQGAKIRITAAGNTVERKCAGWLGGSILASLGTFHQLWISKAEWEEQGSSRLENATRSEFLEKRCK
ncbi:protein of unknown function [Taphrina deformans PYCC 5710]|uniref:Actin-related protein 4 n=1 Tax=Taphrina deformans (strain PYCC 5710 / ATCC 11124 / CBS 356.35 / IMI 108563 / JCM 9778 / NBRC 8474) TaxID=1097556 RepID=R4XHN9_TAPDE|nr:protein of unknown function [Taphrina deformans PYCC 5710]|eukprot:CCG84038.1 protein of unknown function [Taphrina deformans PYCC 5710]